MERKKWDLHRIKMGCRPEMKWVTKTMFKWKMKLNFQRRKENRPLNCQFSLSVSRSLPLPKAIRTERKTILSCERHESLEICYQLRLQIALKGHKNNLFRSVTNSNEAVESSACWKIVLKITFFVSGDSLLRVR